MKLHNVAGVLCLLSFAAAALPQATNARFYGAGQQECKFAVGPVACASIGNQNCNKTYISCNGGNTKNASECTDGAGSQAQGCDGAGNCAVTNNAKYSTDCKNK